MCMPLSEAREALLLAISVLCVARLVSLLGSMTLAKS